MAKEYEVVFKVGIPIEATSITNATKRAVELYNDLQTETDMYITVKDVVAVYESE